MRASLASIMNSSPRLSTGTPPPIPAVNTSPLTIAPPPHITSAPPIIAISPAATDSQPHPSPNLSVREVSVAGSVTPNSLAAPSPHSEEDAPHSERSAKAAALTDAFD